MSANTGIEWTDATWNPIRGCSRVSAGCQHCYAEAVAARFSGPGQAYEGLARRRSNGEPQWTGEVRVIEQHLYDPLRWKKPKRIFVNSMSDLFHEQLVVDDIAHIFAVMALAPHHTFQVLTKRAAAMREVLADPDWPDILAAHVLEIAVTHNVPHGQNVIDEADLPLPNVWLGVSVENQAAADERIPQLLETPAAVRFLSCEPLLDRVDLRSACVGDERYIDSLLGARFGSQQHLVLKPQVTQRIDWVIVGGESGNGARLCSIQWVRDLVAQCQSTRVPVFVKQLGKWIDGDHTEFGLVDRWLFLGGDVWAPGVVGEHNRRRPQGAIAFRLFDAKCGDMNEWPDDLRVREFPHVPNPEGATTG